MFRQDSNGEVSILPSEFSPMSSNPSDLHGMDIQAFL
jgi:hypothetical protein